MAVRRSPRGVRGAPPGDPGATKPFPHGTANGYRRGCREDCCRTAHTTEARSKNRTDRGRELQRNQDYKKKYGITIEEYEEMLSDQGGTCKLCDRPPKTRRLAVDHDHHTGRVRGLLCYRCNRALPNYVTREWLLKAADYITELQDREATDDRGRTVPSVEGQDPGGDHFPDPGAAL